MIHTAKTTSANTPAVSFDDDANTGLHSSAADTLSLVAGGVSAITVNSSAQTLALSSTFKVPQIVEVALGVADTGGGVVSWQNPTGVSIIIGRVFLNITTVSTGAGTVDVGTTATTATTSSDNLIDGADTNAAVALFNNVDDKGSNGKSRQLLAAGKWVTASRASGAMAGLVGSLFIEYWPA